jgi:GH15 family glucan-1,4-alpha-glucosidase
MDYKPIENYGIIGDLHTVALVGNDGSIDYMCFPNFDSPSIFCALLDFKKGGFFKIAPVFEDAKQKQMYMPDSNILLTRFLCSNGICEISDYMVIDSEREAHTLVRRAKSIRGAIKYKIECRPRFDYARRTHSVFKKEDEFIFTPEGKGLSSILLKTDLPLQIENNDVVGEFVLAEGESASFIFEEAIEGEPETPYDRQSNVIRSFKSTMNYWQRWVSRSNYKGRWQEMVNRSALVLKLLTSKRYGSMVASPTFGLPEEIGGERNWDYRYTWIRDASFTLYGLMRLGFTEESEGFMRWIEDRCNDLNPDGSLQIMYGLDGRKVLTEQILPHLEGYKRSSPVRIGNGAYNQMQLDIYGELMDSVYLFNKFGKGISFDLWENLKRLINWVTQNWKRKDEGIWEVRGGPQEFLYSRLMCWVAVDRGIRLAHKRSLPAPLDHWYKVRDEITHEIINNFWNPKLKSFVQYKGAQTLDAANLLMPLVKFLSPTDPKWLSTLDAIGKKLTDDSLVFRYRLGEGGAASDGLRGEEGTFNMCSFWYVECLSRAGDVKKARFFFEKMLGYANHVGLYAEELGKDGQQLGNYPQAFTHLALISAAYDLDRNLSSHRISW